jgi:hypothetical protein
MHQVSRRLVARRKVLVAVGVATGAVVMGVVPGLGAGPGSARALAQYGQRRRARERLVVPAGDRFELLGESLRGGTRVAFGTIEAVLPISAGAVPVVMRTPAGERFQVDVLRRDPKGPAGVADTNELSLFIANRGDGETPTAEAQAHAARGLAAWIGERLAGREGDAVAALAGASEAGDAGLLTFRERQKAHPGGVFSLWS